MFEKYLSNNIICIIFSCIVSLSLTYFLCMNNNLLFFIISITLTICLFLLLRSAKCKTFVKINSIENILLFVFMLCYVLEFIAAIKLKFSDNTPRVYSVPGGKFGMVVCALLCEVSVILAILGLVDYSGGSGTWMQVIGLALTFLVGVVLYFAGKNKKAE